MRYTWTLLGVWSVIIAALLVQDYMDTKSSSIDIAINTARAHLNKDKSFRFWGSLHGGVYVEIRKDTPPNPYLIHMKERDITTQSGRRLTLLNPEYMLRHLNDTFSELYGVAGHITSLKPLRPENSPDPWEVRALKQFENGADEVMETIGSKDKLSYLRLMQPLYVKPECMKCHGHQGYKVGDIRGGIGITLPMYDILRHANRQLKIHTIAFLILWLLGNIILFLGSQKLQKNTKELALSNIDLQREVEERKKADIALQKESSFTSAVLDTAGALIMVIDSNGCIIRFNQTCEQVTGYSTSEVSGKHFWEFLLSPEESLEMQNSFTKINLGGLAMKRIGQIITKDNKRRIIDWANTTFKGSDGKIEYIISIGIDITEEKQLQEQLLHAEKLGAIGKLSASIAHEINNPLFGIRNVLERLKEKADLDHDNMEFAELAVQECDRIKNLIKDLQDFNRPTSGIFMPIDLHQSIENMLLLLRKELENKKITLRRDYAQNLPRINAISDQIKQVILNILNNAIEAIQEIGTITITTKHIDEQVTVEISDSGSGIDEESMQHIFEPFFTTKPSVKGTGLGLSVTYGIVKNHGGSITVSSLGEGTTFSISLPISGENNHGKA